MRHEQLYMRVYDMQEWEIDNPKIPEDTSLSAAIALAVSLYGEIPKSEYWVIEGEDGEILASNFGKEAEVCRTN